jgi:hypothetical protein
MKGVPYNERDRNALGLLFADKVPLMTILVANSFLGNHHIQVPFTNDINCSIVPLET